MFKFLRKYNKFILAVGGVLLMITFLIPQAIQNLSREAGSSSATLATYGKGQKMTGAQLEEARHELDVLEKNRAAVPGIGKIEKGEHWFLLVHEAKNAGLVPTDRAIEFTPEQLAATGVRDPEFLRQTLANRAGVGQLINLHQTNGLYSDRRLKAAAERYFQTVKAEVAVISADAAKSELVPTEDQILTQFNKYADVLAGSGEQGFGYKLPDRLKIEWMRITPDSVREIIRTSPEFDNVHQRLHWKKNEGGAFGAVDPASAVPPAVSDDLLKKLTTQKLADIARFAGDQFRLNRHALTEKDGWVVLPPDWNQRMLKFQDAAQQIQAKFGIALPSYQAVGDRWLSVNDLATLEGLGVAKAEKVSSRPMTLQELVAVAKEFGGNGVIQIQQDITGPVLTGPDQSIYFFRITATEPAHKPASVEEVRDAVVADLKKIDNFETLARQGLDMKAMAETDGMLKTAMAYNTVVSPPASVYLSDANFLRQMLQFRQNVGVMPSSLPVIGMNRPAVERIIDASLTLPRTVAIDTLPEPNRIVIIPIKEKLAVLVVRLLEATPLSQEMFATLAQQGIVQYLIATDEPGSKDAIADEFSFEALQKRNNFTYTRDQGPSETDDANPPAAATPANAS